MPLNNKKPKQTKSFSVAPGSPLFRPVWIAFSLRGLLGDCYYFCVYFIFIFHVIVFFLISYLTPTWCLLSHKNYPYRMNLIHTLPLIFKHSFIYYQIILIKWSYLIFSECSRTALFTRLSLVCWVLWHINLCRLSNTKSIFMLIICSIENNSV